MDFITNFSTNKYILYYIVSSCSFLRRYFLSFVMPESADALETLDAMMRILLNSIMSDSVR